MAKHIENATAKEYALATETDMMGYDFHRAENFKSYCYLGVHRMDDGSYVFRTWAPGALAVSLCSDFTDWTEGLAMQRLTEGGVFACVVSGDRLPEGKKYKYRIVSAEGKVFLKSDPYAVYFEMVPGNASKVYTDLDFSFGDAYWMQNRGKCLGDEKNFYPHPLNIYQVHFGSFLRHPDGRYASYTEIADKLIPYVRQMGYTHVELLPVMEHPKDESLGYLSTGFFAPTSRFGTPREFASFVDRLHQAGIGVILDFNVSGFAYEEHGLSLYDGSAIYEYADDHPNGKYSFFDYRRPEVQSFLISSAMFWLAKYHVDGLQIGGGRNDPDMIAFLERFTVAVSEQFPDVLMISGTSSAGRNRLSKKEKAGFDLKWRAGWTKDLFDYASLDPISRMNHPLELSLSEGQKLPRRFVLPISHYDVCVGKLSLIDRVQGSYDQKFAQMRTLFMFLMSYPGKKLNFMGNEYGQFREWSYDSELEWFMLNYDMHKRLQRYVSDLNHIYLTTPALYENDFSENGFKRLMVEGDVVAYNRYDLLDNEVIILISFAGEDRDNFLLPVSGKYSRYNVLIDTTSDAYTARPVRRSKTFETITQNGKMYLQIPAFSCSGILLKPDPFSKTK